MSICLSHCKHFKVVIDRYRYRYIGIHMGIDVLKGERQSQTVS